jgi:hypothetical protein
MNWVRQNRFLAGYLAVLLVGVGVLGFLVYSSYGRYSQVSDDYHTQVTELKRLQDLSPYPDAQNLQRYSQVRENYAVAVADLQKQLASLQPKPETPPPTPLEFQDRLRRVVDEVTKSAQQSGVTLPENFYLGFEQYRGAPPDTAATSALSAELDAISDLVDILLRQHITGLTAIKRGPLPSEAGGAAAVVEPTRGGRPGPAAPGAANLVARHPVEIEFNSSPNAFREALNKITAAPRLYVVAALKVRNEVDKGPPRQQDEPAGGPNAPPEHPPGTPEPTGPQGTPAVDQNGVPVQPLPEKGPPPLRYVVGLEKVDVAARIDLVQVAPPHERRP